MPIYEFYCPNEKCAYQTEEQVSVADRDSQYCPLCGTNLSREIPITDFALRGVGWYKDGYSGGEKAYKTLANNSTLKRLGKKPEDYPDTIKPKKKGDTAKAWRRAKEVSKK
jgi:putative FmdB family regulatory protein